MELLSGFLRADFLLAFDVADDEARARIASLCEREWQATRITATTWEVTSALSPDALEAALLPLLSAGDHAVYYYLADSKRIFRVVLTG